jgi:DNA-binding LytR/AlgR family response regulator
MGEPVDRVLLHLDSGERRVVDPGEVYYLEVLEEATRVRLRSARALIDTRPADEVVPLFAPHGFLQIHREYAVNLRRIRTIRRRTNGRDWEVKLEPPVNRVLPVSRGLLQNLWKAYGAE